MKFVPLSASNGHTIDGVIVKFSRGWAWSLMVDVRSNPQAIPGACGTAKTLAAAVDACGECWVTMAHKDQGEAAPATAAARAG